jgi:hypothetical protein
MPSYLPQSYLPTHDNLVSDSCEVREGEIGEQRESRHTVASYLPVTNQHNMGDMEG